MVLLGKPTYMKVTEPERRATHPLVLFAAAVIIIVGLRAAEAIIVPFLLALFITIISSPPLIVLKRHGVPNWLALIVVISGLIVIGLALVMLIGSSLDELARNLPRYQAHLQVLAIQALLWLEETGIELNAGEILGFLDPGALIRLIANVFNSLGGTLANAFVILLAAAFMLSEASIFNAKLAAISKDPAKTLAQVQNLTRTINHYIGIKTLTSIATGILVALWLMTLNVNYPILWGVIAFLLNYVPNIGSVIAAIPVIVLALIEQGVGTAAWVTIGYLVINNVSGILEPRLMGRSLGLSTLVVFISLVFWGWVLGPIGMFLSVPLTMMLKIALENFAETRWLAVLLGSEASSMTIDPGAPDADPIHVPGVGTKDTPVEAYHQPEKSVAESAMVNDHLPGYPKHPLDQS